MDKEVLHTGEISIFRKEADFDRACDEARRTIVSNQIDEYGHAKHIPDWHRSDCSIEIEFSNYYCSCGYVGVEHYYEFTWKALKHKDEEDE